RAAPPPGAATGRGPGAAPDRRPVCPIGSPGALPPACPRRQAEAAPSRAPGPAPRRWRCFDAGRLRWGCGPCRAATPTESRSKGPTPRLRPRLTALLAGGLLALAGLPAPGGATHAASGIAGLWFTITPNAPITAVKIQAGCQITTAPCARPLF